MLDRNKLGKGTPMGKTRLGLMVANLLIPGLALGTNTAGTDKRHRDAIAGLPILNFTIPQLQ